MKSILINGIWIKKILFGISGILFFGSLNAQSTSQLLQKAFQQFEGDSQLKYAISSLYVIDAKTGKVIFDRNSRVGLAPASTQKIITSVTAFEILGRDFQYTTNFSLAKSPAGETGLVVKGTGDPTLGSWRFHSTRDSIILKKLLAKLNNTKLAFILVLDGDMSSFGTGSLPEGYMWQDMGNYYGSVHNSINWKENQYDVSFSSGSPGSGTHLVKIGLDTTGYEYYNEVTSGAIGTGDNSYIYSAPYSRQFYIRGTVPPNQNSFTISGSDPDPALQFGRALKKYLEPQQRTNSSKTGIKVWVARSLWDVKGFNFDDATKYVHDSPSLDSIIYWFNKKSINLYGEALLRTMAVKKGQIASTDSGVVNLQRFWRDKGLDENELNIADGSGLSPINRVTTHAQVEILKYARDREWFSYFYNALPEYNGMKMKSGTIRDVKGFCGYHKSKDGNEYIFSFLINNYNGPASMVVNKMYKVLDVLK